MLLMARTKGWLKRRLTSLLGVLGRNYVVVKNGLHLVVFCDLGGLLSVVFAPISSPVFFCYFVSIEYWTKIVKVYSGVRWGPSGRTV